MLRDSHKLIGDSVEAVDGVVGIVKDLYFDDESWVIRYFVVATGSWLSGRRVLIAPAAVVVRDVPGSKRLPVNLTKQQVENSPHIDTQEPVSQQYESDYLQYYGYAYYWGGGNIWGRGGAHPGSLSSGLDSEGAVAERRRSDAENRRLDARADAEHSPRGDHHLRSVETVKTYHIHASDGEIGHVKGFLLDEVGWAIRYLIVDTGHFWSGHDVLIAPAWIEEIRWDDNHVLVGMTRDAIRRAPTYQAAECLTRESEERLHAHYGFGPYWAREVELENPELKFTPPESARSSDRL